MYRLRLVAKGGMGGYVIWSRITLKIRPPKAVAPLHRTIRFPRGEEKLKALGYIN